MSQGVSDYIRKSNQMPKGPLSATQPSGPQEPIVDGGIAQFKDYEIVVQDERHFVLRHRDDADGKPQFQISLIQS